MVRVRADWVKRQAGRELDHYLRQRAWHWAVRCNYALAADYTIRLLNRHPRDPLGLLLGEVAGASTNQDVFGEKCREAQKRLCFIKDVQTPAALLKEIPSPPSSSSGLSSSTTSASASTALPSRAEVEAFMAAFKGENEQRAQSGLVATGLGDEQITVQESEALKDTQAAVRRSSLRTNTAVPLAEMLEPKGTVYGRGLYATQRLSPRTSVLLDAPFLVQRMDENRCAHCLHVLSGGGGPSASASASSTHSSGVGEVCCPHCEGEETYCSHECQQAAWEGYHACCCRSVNPSFADWAAAMREVLYSGDAAAAEDSSSQARAALSCLAVAKVCAMATVQQAYPLALPGLRGLRGVADYEPATALSEIGAIAVTLSAALHQSFLYMEEVLSLCALLQTNEFLVTGGIALYPVLSLLNHSCDPNCTVVKGGAGHHAEGQRTLVTLRDIRDGEQLFIDYNSHLTSTLDYEQRKALCAQRHFECFCAKCVRRQ